MRVGCLSRVRLLCPHKALLTPAIRCRRIPLHGDILGSIKALPLAPLHRFHIRFFPYLRYNRDISCRYRGERDFWLEDFRGRMRLRARGRRRHLDHGRSLFPQGNLRSMMSDGNTVESKAVYRNHCRSLRWKVVRHLGSG